MQDYRNLAVWQKAHALVLEICKLNYPQHEAFALRALIRRTALGIPSKIAEGSGSVNDQGFYNCLCAASSLTSELDYQLLVTRDLEYIDTPTFERLSAAAIEVKKMVSGLIRTIRS